MNEFKFKKIISEVQHIKLTQAEKNSLRIRVARHMNNHPIGSYSYFFNFRYAMTVALALMITIGSGTFVASASQSALPGEKLYSVKRTTEKLKKISLKSPSEKVSYELALIDKRFSETNQLISKGNLTAKTEAVVISAIEQHTNDFKTEAKKLAVNDPADALSYNTKLTNTLKTGTHILMALSDQQSTTLAKADTVSPNTLVLAAYATAQKVTEEKKQLETIVVSDTNIATIKTAEKRYTETLALLAKQNIVPSATPLETSVSTETVKSTPVVTSLEVLPEKTLSEIKTGDVQKTELKVAKKTTESSLATKTISDTKNIPLSKLQTLLNSLQQNYEAKKYGQVIIIADQIEQQLNETEKIQQAEKTYNVTIPSSESTEISNPETTVKGATEITPEIPVKESTEKQEVLPQVKK